MQKTSYALMNPDNGRFLRVYSTEDTGYREFTHDEGDPIYETEEAAAVLDIMFGRREGRLVSREARSDLLPRLSKWLVRSGVRIEDHVPVAFVRELVSVVEGGDVLVSSMNLRLVRFDNSADPESIWLDDIEVRHSDTNAPSP